MCNSREYQLAKYGCYATNISMSVVATLSPILFVTFREIYGISYTLLGLLVVINFFTQLIVDLIFSFFAKYFNIHKTVRLMPFITFCGLLIYAILPYIYPGQAYLWLAVGTVIFSVSSGLNEVLASPLIAAIPCENPEREMSKLHSTYAWGVVLVVLVSTFFIKIVGRDNWTYLALLWSVIPFSASVMLNRAKLPHINVSSESEQGKKVINAGTMLCVGCIFLGGAAECTMTQWVSGFLEKGMGIDKIWGDILGVATFAFLLGLGRTLFAKCGKNVTGVMIWGMVGATLCYVVAGLSMNPIIALVACSITGICVSMLWPGMIIYIGEKFPCAGVSLYALMAAGGDLGASVGPQLMGIVSDEVSSSGFALQLMNVLNISTEQIGMKAGVLVSALFPMAGIILIFVTNKYLKKRDNNLKQN